MAQTGVKGRDWTLILVSVLAGGAALVSGALGALSLTRIAGSNLGFPPGFAWSLTGSVDIGAAAGAILWVASSGVNRSRGRALNIACSTISAIGVGLDHATNALGWWVVPAGLVGAFLPALSTWLVHVLAHLVTEQPGASSAAPDPFDLRTIIDVGRNAVVTLEDLGMSSMQEYDAYEARRVPVSEERLAEHAPNLTKVSLLRERSTTLHAVPTSEADEAAALGVKLDAPVEGETEDDRRRREERNRKRLARARK